MKSRNREINIFNMSLMDVLCGALGAFCFLMLVLFPYYKSNRQQQEEPPQEKGVDPKTYEEAMARIREMEDRLRACQAARQDCKTDVDNAQKTITQLQMRTPLTVGATFLGPNDFDIYVYDDRTNESGAKTPQPNAGEKQRPNWGGDRWLDFTSGIGTETWTVRDVPANTTFQIYYKLFKQAAGNQPTEVFGTIVPPQDDAVVIPKVTLTQQGQMMRVATIAFKGDGHSTVKIEVPPETPQK